MSDPTKMVIDTNRIGTKGYPRHWQAIGAEPPMKYEESGGPVPTVPDNPTLEELAAYSRDLSWRIRVTGTAISGVHVRCDDGAVALINGMAALAKADGDRVFSFDAGSGVMSLTAAEAVTLATAVGEWVQKTFDRRAAVLAAIASGTVTTKVEIDAAFNDVTASWSVE